MAHATDIAKISAQEAALVFTHFNENDALEIGLTLVRNLQVAGKSGLVDISLFDRQLFAHSMTGATADNAEWVRRKNNVVRRFHVSSYRKALELMDAGKEFETARGHDPAEYAAAGGAFPIRFKSGPVIGSITLSGLPQRDDHMYVVDAIAAHLGMDAGLFALD